MILPFCGVGFLSCCFCYMLLLLLAPHFARPTAHEKSFPLEFRLFGEKETAELSKNYAFGLLLRPHYYY